MSGWIDWSGGERPVSEDTIVEARLRGGLVLDSCAIKHRWTHTADPHDGTREYDIVAYRVVKPQPNCLGCEQAVCDTCEPIKRDQPAPIHAALDTLKDSEWIEWAGGQCPVKPDTIVDVKFRNGLFYEGRAVKNRWTHMIDAHDIVAYRITRAAPQPAEPIHAALDTLKPLSGKTFAFTGILPWLSRDEAIALVKAAGGKAMSAVSAKTDYVVAGQEAGSKLDKAHELGVHVLDEQAFRRMLGMAPAQAETASKPTNPKDAIGSVKLPLHLWPAEATALGSLGLLEGDCKYGRNNYIAGDGVIASIYVDAAKRHLDAWFSGEEFNPDLFFAEDGEPGVGLSHLGNALACIAIIVKAQAHGKLIDDRDFSGSPGAYRKFVDGLTPLVKKIQGKFADKKPKRYTIADNPKEE